MHDPVYAVGSFYIDGTVYPDKEIVENALRNLTRDLDQYRRMLIGEKVMVERHGKKVDLRVFAGYTRENLRENISDLEEITSELERFMTEDYT
jgi:hypothetical protein